MDYQSTLMKCLTFFLILANCHPHMTFEFLAILSIFSQKLSILSLIIFSWFSNIISPGLISNWFSCNFETTDSILLNSDWIIFCCGSSWMWFQFLLLLIISTHFAITFNLPWIQISFWSFSFPHFNCDLYIIPMIILFFCLACPICNYSWS